MLLFFVEMGNCQSRLCCTDDIPETTPPKTARSEKSAKLEVNSHRPNPERFFPYSGSDGVSRINESCEKERVVWRDVQSVMADKAEEARRDAHDLKSTTKNVCDGDDPNHPAYSVSKEADEYTETSTKPKKVDEETRKGFLRQLHRTAWKDVNERIMKAREEALSRGENDVNLGASTSAESPSCNVPSSDEWLIHHPCLFDTIACSEGDNDDEENCFQFPATGYAAVSIKLKMFFRYEEHEVPSKEPEFDTISPVEELHAEIAENKPKEGSTPNWSIRFVSPVQPLATESDVHRNKSSGQFSPGPSPCASPRAGALTRVLKRPRNNSVEGLVSRTESEDEDSALSPAMTSTSAPSPENRAESRGGFLRGVISRIAHRRSHRVHHVTSPENSQSSSNSAIHGNPKNSSDRVLQSTPQTSNRSSLTRAMTSTSAPSPENRADSRGRFLRGVISRIAHRRSHRVHHVTSPENSQSSSNSAIHGNPKNSIDHALQSTPQTSNRSSLTRAWLNLLGRRSPSTSGRVTQILVRPYDESQAENGRRLVPSPASVDRRSREEVSAPPSRVQSSTSGIVTFQIEDDIEVCSFTSSPSFDARSVADLGGGT